MDLAQISIAFAAGIQTFFSPCAFALLPAYISYFLGQKNQKKPKNALKIGTIAVTGFATVILLLATLTYLIGTQVKQFFTQITPLIAIALIFIGITWLIDKKTLTLKQINIELPKSSAYFFGVAYAVSAITCMFPIYLTILLPSINQGIIEITLNYLAYLTGMAIMMITTIYASTLSNKILINYLKNYMKYVTKISGTIILISGLYILINYTEVIQIILSYF